jgi:twitching motility two-component system response regulator PilH
MAISKVLCVDDSSTDLANIKNIVVGAGYTVVTASSGKEAIAKAKSEKPDLIFMDVVMEGTDGFEACREITGSADTKHIPIVFTTSKSQKADQVWAELQGGKGLIGKPFTDADILTQLNAF